MQYYLFRLNMTLHDDNCNSDRIISLKSTMLLQTVCNLDIEMSSSIKWNLYTISVVEVEKNDSCINCMRFYHFRIIEQYNIYHLLNL